MHFKSIVAISIVIGAIPCRSGAQHTRPAGDASASQSRDEMQALIKAFSGDWSLKLKFEPSKETPLGLESTGKESWHAGPGGGTLTDEEVFTAGPQTVIVVGILW